ncbi:MAG: hypothetical protein KAS32_15165, partial [Candidatus Peribacteraceae bacterium]|nr:hypothetical protein [Candidatus Peribacteraceae bacterium]
MIKLKKGVSISALKPQMVLAILVINDIYKSHGSSELTITAGDDGKHSVTSLHYSGNAIDIRTRMFEDFEKEQIAKEIKAALGIDFDV